MITWLQPSETSVVNCFVNAAANAKMTDPALPNMAARNHRGPLNPSADRPPAAAQVTTTTVTQACLDGMTFPPCGAETARKAARPPAAASEPPHSRQPRW